MNDLTTLFTVFSGDILPVRNQSDWTLPLESADFGGPAEHDQAQPFGFRGLSPMTSAMLMT